VDSDGDGLVDLSDPGCKNASDPSEQMDCGDGADNDGDGQIDVADPGCDSDEDVSERSVALACDDGLDDDGDGRIDFYGASPDPGCVALTDPSEQEATHACDNGLDDDGDGAVDFRPNCSATSSCDTGCSDLLDASEQDPAVACDDGADNDGDGAIDHPADANCSSRIDRSEGEFVVNGAADGFDAIPGDGLCADASGACTLRAAIDETNALVGSDDVMVPAGSYVLAQGALTIDDDTTLNGAGADLTVIDAGGTDTVAVIGSYETGPRVRLRDLTITGGRLQFPGFAIFGAAGISSLFADLELDGVVVQGNIVGAEPFPLGAGGILQVGGHLRILRSTIAGNAGRSPTGLPMAGGIEVMSWTDGGGPKAPGTPPSICYPAVLEVVNSTIGDNVGGGLGVGRISGGCVATATVTSTTITANEGAGLSAGSLGTTLTLRSTIVAQQASGADCALPASLAMSAGHNLAGDGSCHLTDPTDLPNADAMLGPLQHNGGPTETHALLPGSLAIDAIPLADCTWDDDGDPGTAEVPLATDQRGVARPQGAGCDIGAVEVTVCANGLDDDGDGLVDYPADPGCKSAQSKTERPQCQDAIDNDGDGKLDFDGGASANHGVALGPPDPQCTQPWRTTEIPTPSCGLGVELAALLPAIALLRRRRKLIAP
jgi:hypothetical protein